MNPGLQRARLNARRRMYAPTSSLELRSGSDAALVALSRDFTFSQDDDGTMGFQVADAATSAANFLATDSVILTTKTGATPIRYANGNRARPEPRDGTWLLTGYLPAEAL